MSQSSASSGNVSASFATVFNVTAKDEPDFPFAISMLVSDDESDPSNHFAVVNAAMPQQTIIRLPLHMLSAFSGMISDANDLLHIAPQGEEIEIPGE